MKKLFGNSRVMLSLKLAALAVLLAVAATLSGCATTESENLSERPWNSPKSWETGLPSGLMEGR